MGVKTKAVRLYGKQDIRLEEFELPTIKDNEILVRVVSDSVCMSTYKAVLRGAEHKRVPDSIATEPIIIGHEFSGDILEVGKEWRARFKTGGKFALQPALNYKGSLACPGYSYPHFGGAAMYNIIPAEAMESDSFLSYEGAAYFQASLAEPMSCIVGAFHASYHTEPGKHAHNMGIVENGKMAILAGAGPMGLGAIDYALHNDRHPSLLVVTDVDDLRLDRARSIFPPEQARENGIEVVFVNTRNVDDPIKLLRQLTRGTGFDDVFVFAPVPTVIEQGDQILGQDGCLNSFAGPTDSELSAKVNFYNVHYSSSHVMGLTGGNTEDLREALRLSAEGRIHPEVMVTHVGGLGSVVETTLHLPQIPGGKKLIYTHLDMELTAIDSFAAKGKEDARFTELARIINENNGLWCVEAETYLLAHWQLKG